MTPSSKVPDGMPLSARVAAKVALDDVRLTEARLDLHPISTMVEAEVDVRVRTAWERRSEGLDVVVGVWLRLLVTEASEADLTDPASDQAEPLLSIVVEHRLSYDLADEFEAADEEFEAFVEQSGVLTAWPFARETIQSLAAKAGFPQVTLPMRRFHLPVVAAETAKPPAKRKAPAARKATASKKAPAQKKAVARKAAGARKRASRPAAR